MSAPTDTVFELIHPMQSIIGDVIAWATANMSKLNNKKPKLMLIISERTKLVHNQPTSITVGNAQISIKAVCDEFRIYIRLISL